MWRGTLNGRRNIFKVFQAWKEGKRKASGAISTDGRTVYSYSTAIATVDDDGVVILNADKYSKTTTVHQNGIRYGVTSSAAHGWMDVQYVTDVPQGASGATLERRARAAA